MPLARDIHPDTLAALSGTFFPVVFAFVDWPGGAARAHSNAGAITWGGNDWLGVGGYGSIEVPQEDGLVPDEAVLSIIGTTDMLLEQMGVSAGDLRGRDGEIFLGVTTKPGGNVLIGEPVSLFSGYIDTRSMPAQMVENGIQETLRIGLGSGPSARAAAKIVHSDEDQKARFPNDTLFRHLAFADSRRANPAVW